MAGRRPKDKRMRLVQGNPGKRGIPPDLPEPALGRPEMPAGSALGEEGQAEWDRLAGLLEGEGRLTKSDGPMLTGAAAAWETILEIREQLSATTRTGLPAHRSTDDWMKLKTAERMQWDVYRKFCNDLCLSAGTRARARTTESAKPTKFQAFQGRKGQATG